MTVITAVIPTIGESPWLPALVDRLWEDGADQVVLLSNARDDGPHLDGWRDWPNVAYVKHHDGIYQSWNMGIRLSRPGVAVVLNDDVELEPGALQKVAGAFDRDELLTVVGFDYGVSTANRVRKGRDLVYVHGTYQHGGVGGFAFAVRTEAWPGADEDYEWWYGDDDLMRRFEERGGRLAVVAEAKVVHHWSTTGSRHPWTEEAKGRDAERFRRKWGDR